jgi:hypothetical protein
MILKMVFLLLFLLALKHFIADFVFQSEYQVSQKGIYGAGGGIEHALWHGMFTFVVLAVVLELLVPAVVLGVLDALVHYHIDYIKARWGSRDANTQRFWRELGLDQFCHMTFYIWLAWILYNDLS